MDSEERQKEKTDTHSYIRWIQKKVTKRKQTHNYSYIINGFIKQTLILIYDGFRRKKQRENRHSFLNKMDSEERNKEKTDTHSYIRWIQKKDTKRKQTLILI